MGEYQLASQAGPGLRHLPLVPGDPESGAGEEECYVEKFLFYPF